jgi:exonuclease VII small subunit
MFIDGGAFFDSARDEIQFFPSGEAAVEEEAIGAGPGKQFRHILAPGRRIAHGSGCIYFSAMELLSLAQYLEKTANPKRAAKLVKRSVKLYRHASKDLAHAESDLAHAKEDCLHTIESYENTLEDTKQFVADWAKIGDGSEEAEPEVEDNIFPDDFSDEESEDDERLGDHLDHAAAQFQHAMKDASDALENLDQIDEYIEELLDNAEEEGFALSLTEVKAEIIRQAGAQDAPAAEPAVEPADSEAKPPRNGGV